MNALAEALGMALPGSAAIPAPYKERGQSAYKTGLQIVEMVHADRKPSDIMTREAFENAVVANTAIGESKLKRGRPEVSEPTRRQSYLTHAL